MANVTTFAEANRFQRAMRLFAASTVGSAIFSRTAHHADRAVARVTGGSRTFAGILTGVPTVLLTTTGAKSGKARTVPVLGVPHPAGMGVIASNFGSTKHPSWYHNLRADPACSLSIDGVVQTRSSQKGIQCLTQTRHPPKSEKTIMSTDTDHIEEAMFDSAPM